MRPFYLRAARLRRALWLAALLAIAGCGIRTSEGNAPGAVVGLDKTPTVGLGYISSGVSRGAGITAPHLARPTPGDPYSGVQTVESERKELLGRVEQLAEAQKAELERESSAELEARRKELQAASELECAEGKKQITKDCAQEIQRIEVGLMERRVNLRLKMAAARTRLGLFGPAADEETNKQIARLNSELEQMDEGRAENVKSARDKETRKILKLEKRLKGKLEAELAGLREDLDRRLQSEMKAVRDRLSADLVAGVFDGAGVSRKAPDAVKNSSGDSLDAVQGRAGGAAELQFERSYRGAAASQRAREIEIDRREREDAASSGGNFSAGNGRGPTLSGRALAARLRRARESQPPG